MNNQPVFSIIPFGFRPEEWMEKARCKGRELGAHDTDRLPYPSSKEYRTAAEDLCRGCTVSRECAGYALKTGMTGVVVAGVPLRMHDNKELYEELKEIADGL